MCFRYSLFILIFFLPILTIAQQDYYEDVLYLKDGSIVKGMIVEQIPKESLKIRIAGGAVMLYRYTEIYKITKEKIIAPAQQRKIITKDNLRKRGFSFSFLAIHGIETGKNKADYYNTYLKDVGRDIYLGLQQVNGYQVNRHLFAGIGFGLQGYLTGTMFYPVFVDVKWNFILRKATPFVDLAVGTSFTENDISGKRNYQYSAGPMINPSLGMKLFIRPKTGLILFLGYNFQRSKYRFEESSDVDPYHSTISWKVNDLSSVMLKFGFTY